MQGKYRALAVAVVCGLALAGAAFGATKAVIVGTSGNDTLWGTPNADVMYGKAGNDTLYGRAVDHALTRGIIIADTKFEFGLLGEDLLWIDEALTPDSSRFWPSDQYSPGKPQPSFDKQYVRDYLERIGWDKQPPAPALPADVVAATTGKYREAYQSITGHALN